MRDTHTNELREEVEEFWKHFNLYSKAPHTPEETNEAAKACIIDHIESHTQQAVEEFAEKVKEHYTLRAGKHDNEPFDQAIDRLIRETLEGNGHE